MHAVPAHTPALLLLPPPLLRSSIADNLPSKISPSVGERAWPYQMDGGIPQDCTTGGWAGGRAGGLRGA